MSDLTTIRARESDPATFTEASQRAAPIKQRLDIHQMKKLAIRAQIAHNDPAKIIWLRRLADQLGPATKGIVPCGAGCSHCCHTPVLVSPAEAALIADESGAQLRQPGGQALPNQTNYSYIGTPCPFLVDNQCSIYAARPFACRVHYSTDADNLLCQLVPGENIRAPYLNVDPWHVAYVMTFPPPEGNYFDIRDFFSTPAR